MTEEFSSLGICDFVKWGEGVTFGTWVWYEQEILHPDSVLEFLTKNNVNEIYLSYAPAMGIENYRTFIAKSTKAGVRVSLIGADAHWVLKKGHADRDTYFAFYENYQNTAKENEKFYGLHMDIEPHQLEEWTNDQETTVKGYCDFVLLAREVADRTNTLLELDIPCWFGGFQTQDCDEIIPLSEFCLRHADATLLMSYRDNARDVLEFANFDLDLSKKYGKKINLALETGNIYEEVNITFDHLGTVPLNDELHKLRKIIETEYQACNVGYAVHHYNSWVVLPPYGNPKGEDFPYDNPSYAHLLTQDELI